MNRLDGQKKRSPKGIDWLMCSVIPEPNSGCWLWIGKMTHGYGKATIAMREVPAHRFSYELFRGPIPAGLVLDHLCRVPLCVNPDHLEPVTNRENVRRGISAELNRHQYIGITHCPDGHPYSGDNLYINPKGARNCRTCMRRRTRNWRMRNGKVNLVIDDAHAREWRADQETATGAGPVSGEAA